MRKAAGFTYRPRSAESVKKRAERKGGRFDSIFKQNFDSWRPKPGANRVRILPPTWEDYDHYGYRIWVHRFVGPDNSTYLCPNKMLNKKCAICAVVKETRDGGDEEEAKRIQATEQFVYYILDRDEKTPSPDLWTVSWTMDRDIAKLTIDDRTGKVLLIDHPDEGFDLTFDRDGQGMKTRYSAYRIDRDTSPVSDDEAEQEEILSSITKNPIPDTLQFYPNDYLQRMMDGTGGEKDEDLDEEAAGDEEEEKPTRKAASKANGRRRAEPEDEPAKPARRASRRDEPEDEPDEPDEVEEEVVEDDEPEEPPRRSAKPARRASRRDEPEDEPEDEPDEPAEDEPDEPEDEPPPRRGRRDEPERPARRASRRDEPEDEPEVEDEEPPPRRASRPVSRRDAPVSRRR